MTKSVKKRVWRTTVCTITFKRCHLSELDKLALCGLIEAFIFDQYGISFFGYPDVVLNFGPYLPARGKGPFEDFLNLYNPETGEIFIDVTGFYELVNPSNIQNVAHLVAHELVHVAEMISGIMKVLNPKQLVYQNKIYTRAPFHSLFYEKLMKIDPSLAQEYHCLTLPWEYSAYHIPEQYFGLPLWKYAQTSSIQD